MNRKSAIAALLVASGSVHAALQPGDLAFTAFNATPRHDMLDTFLPSGVAAAGTP